MSVLKKNDKLRVCKNFRNLITLKDKYPMPIANMQIDATCANKIISFIDSHSSYNQIFVIK